jgi:ABC-2 type transport system ATP-binding protein
MKRRLNICLALIHDPAILIFDEPEAGLDPQSRVLVREIIRSLAEKKTVILTTHNMDEADRLADRVAIIDHGALLQLDTPEQLKRSIGEGDILEIELSTENPQSIAAAMETLNRQCDSMKYSEPVLIMKSPDLITKIPAITGVLQQHHVQAKEMRIRENSLEDVFIHLTGKTLRQ